jgi:hypothetical protein
MKPFRMESEYETAGEETWASARELGDEVSAHSHFPGYSRWALIFQQAVPIVQDGGLKSAVNVTFREWRDSFRRILGLAT